MSIAGLFSSSLFSYGSQNSQNQVQNQVQQFRKEFQQLGQDLQSGNLSAAQSDFATLQQDAPQSSSTSSTQSNNPIAQAFNQLSQDLSAGNLTGAQQDYSTIQQDFQSQGAQGAHHHHRHHGGGDGQNSNNSLQSEVSQLFNELGQALQSGDLSTAQQAYTAIQQDFLQTGQSSTASSGSTAGTTPTVQATA